MKKVRVLSVFALFTLLSGAALAHGGKHKGHMKKMDTNGDGKVTLAEAQESVKKHFTELDKNKNGTLEKDELSGKFTRRFARADANGDGKVTLAEAQAKIKDWFTRKDTNKDGVLSGDELRFGKHGAKDRRS